MKYINLIIVISLIAFGLTSCYEEADWLGDNTTTEGKHFPVIAGWESLDGTSFDGGETIELDLRYWSVDPIEEIRLIEVIDSVSNTVATFDYMPSFSEDSQTDKLVMSYTVPDITNEIVLQVMIVNENGLTRETTLPWESGPASGTVNAIEITVD